MKHYFSSGLVGALCLALSTNAWGQSFSLPAGGVTGLPAVRPAYSAQDLEKKLNDGSRDLTIVMQQLEELKRRSVKIKVDALITKFPLTAPKTGITSGILQRMGITRFFKGLWTSDQKITAPTAGIKSTKGGKPTLIPGLWGRLMPGPSRTGLTFEGILKADRKRLIDELKRLAEGVVPLISTDAAIRANASAAPDASQLSLLGAVYNAMTAVRLAGANVSLGFKGSQPLPECKNVILTERREDGAYAGQYEPSYVSRYFKAVAGKAVGSAEEQELRFADATYALGKIAQGFECLSMRDVSAWDTQSASAALHLHFWLWANGRGVAARAFIENDLPAEHLAWMAAKSFKIPQTLRLLFLESEYESLRSAQPVALSSVLLKIRDDQGVDVQIGDRVAASFPPLNVENTTALRARYGAAPGAASGSVPLVKLLLSDPSRTTLQWLGGIWEPYPYDVGSPLAVVDLGSRSYLDLVQNRLDFAALGEGTCSSHVAVANNMICQDRTTCRALENLAAGPTDSAAAGGGAVGNIGSYLAGFSRQPGGGLSEVTHFGVSRGGAMSSFCGGGGGGGGGPIPPNRSCMVATGRTAGFMDPEQEKVMRCAFEAGLRGQMQNFEAFINPGRASFGCRMDTVMDGGDGGAPSDRDLRERQAHGARANIEAIFGGDGLLPGHDGLSPAEAIAESLNSIYEDKFGLGLFSVEDGANLFLAALEVAEGAYIAGDLESGGNLAAAMLNRAFDEVMNVLGPQAAVHIGEGRRLAAEGAGSGSSGGSSGSELVDPWEDGSKPSSELMEPWADKAGKQQCDPEAAGCTTVCGPADEAIRAMTECLGEGSGGGRTINQCEMAPDLCDGRGEPGTTPPAILDGLLGTCSWNPPNLADSTCPNVYCAEGDTTCCGGGGGGAASSFGPGGAFSPGGAFDPCRFSLGDPRCGGGGGVPDGGAPGGGLPGGGTGQF